MGMSDFARTTIDDADLAKYDRLGDEWWDPAGPMGTLHKFNPVRVDWITDLLTAEGLATGPAGTQLQGLRILDVGSGGGILSESLARRGASMVGVDPAPNNIAVAARHAETGGLAIDYRCTTVETLATAGERFDAVLVMEVVEHVRDVAGFLRDAASMVKPGGLMIGATLNRTLKSYALAIVGAEYVLRWLPRGTHDWHQFVTPAEFKGFMARAGLAPFTDAGVTFNPLRDRWHLTRDTGCNYMVAARRPAG
jgi:2-polyprenyl-6-hydroxyphenyl methylase/3-demethylubiquinone-9 3-methyltransferase